MNKLLAAVLLSSISLSAFAAPDPLFDSWRKSGKSTTVAPPASSADAVYGSNFYIVDPNLTIDFTFVISQAEYNHVLWVASWGDDGRIGEWQLVFQKTGDSYNTLNYQLNQTTYSYTAHEGATQVVFSLAATFDGKTNYFYSGAASGNPDKTAHTVAFYDYYNGQTLVGFEDMFRTGQYRADAWDFDDIVFLASNVSRTPPPAIPEPETYAMMLAGLGMIGVVARRRRQLIG